MNNQLIIWDFDGVIADTEHLWIKNWQVLLEQKYNLHWDFDTANKYLGGLSPKSKIENLKQFGIQIGNDFLEELKILDWQAMKNGLSPVDGVENIFQMNNFKQCIATGGNLDKTEQKLKVLDFKKYFDDQHIFTAQQVKEGKPKPDLFLFAAEKMEVLASNSIVIEDSLPGLEAALKAEMTAVAFIGCEMNSCQAYHQKIKDLGVKHIFITMKDLQEWLLTQSL